MNIELFLFGSIGVSLIIAFAINAVIAFLSGLAEVAMKIALFLAIIGIIYWIGLGAIGALHFLA